MTTPADTTPPDPLPPIARAVAPAPPSRRPKWLTVMAGTSLAVALMWIFLAGLIVVLGWMIQVLGQRDPQVLKDAGLSPDLLAHLNTAAAVSVLSGIWLLIAAITAYARRPITRHLHNTLALFRIVLMVGLIAGAGDMAPPPNTALPGSELLSGPLAITLIAGLELLYPVTILIVFNRKKSRDDLYAAARDPNERRP